MNNISINREALGRGIERALGNLIATRGLAAGAGSRHVESVSLRLPPDATERQIAEAVAAALDGAIWRR
jgi:hypothetical protein